MLLILKAHFKHTYSFSFSFEIAVYPHLLILNTAGRNEPGLSFKHEGFEWHQFFIDLVSGLVFKQQPKRHKTELIERNTASVYFISFSCFFIGAH